MPKKQTKEEFITRALSIHGDRYDYSNVVYVNTNTCIEITCKKHGVFKQKPSEHLDGCGCKYCWKERQKSGVEGVGINDYDGNVIVNGIVLRSYAIWREMLRRCYGRFEKGHNNEVYKYCEVCEEWKYFSNFKKWFDENYIKGYQLDKDILVKGNKVYSPDTCCFVPQEINKLLTKHNKKRGMFPLGVSKYGNVFLSYVNCGKKRIYIGSFSNATEAFQAYKAKKEKYIRDIAQTYYDDGKITKRVYDALMKYEVEITD